MERAQLFTSGGVLVATVDVRMDDGHWPAVVTFRGRHYALRDGRYVQSAEVLEATEVQHERA